MSKVYEVDYFKDWIPKGTYFVIAQVFWAGGDLITGEFVGRNKWSQHWDGIIKISKDTSHRKLTDWLEKHIEQNILPVETVNHIKLKGMSKLS